MYNGDIWDQIYLKHLNDAPWLTDAYFEIYSQLINSYLPDNLRDLRLLDYGCGNGKLAFHLLEKGVKVDVAEISQIMISYLQETYFNTSINVYKADHPSILGQEEKYDIVLAWMLFCNINPEVWSVFFQEFYKLMKHNSCIILGGWDMDDPVIIKSKNISPYTERLMWPINKIGNYVGQLFKVCRNDRYSIKSSIYSETRIIRCMKLLKI